VGVWRLGKHEPSPTPSPHHENGCPTLATLLFLSLGWESTCSDLATKVVAPSFERPCSKGGSPRIPPQHKNGCPRSRGPHRQVHVCGVEIPLAFGAARGSIQCLPQRLRKGRKCSLTGLRNCADVGLDGCVSRRGTPVEPPDCAQWLRGRLRCGRSGRSEFPTETRFRTLKRARCAFLARLCRRFACFSRLCRHAELVIESEWAPRLRARKTSVAETRRAWGSAFRGLKAPAPSGRPRIAMEPRCMGHIFRIVPPAGLTPRSASTGPRCCLRDRRTRQRCRWESPPAAPRSCRPVTRSGPGSPARRRSARRNA
jgi:hypothetical protein